MRAAIGPDRSAKRSPLTGEPFYAGSFHQPVREDAMRLDKLLEAVLVAGLVVFSAGYAHAEEFSARLNGFQELGAQNAETGAILSNGSGTLRLSIDKDAGTATFTLTFSGVGTTPLKTITVTQAIIHIRKLQSAGVAVWSIGTNCT